MADSTPIPLYAVPIQEAARSGDPAQMRAMEQKAQEHLDAVKSALDELRAAIGRTS